MRWLHIGLLGALLSITAAPACDCNGPPGQVMVVLQADLSMPKDIDALRIQVFSKGREVFTRSYEDLGDPQKGLTLPSTLAIVEGDDRSPRVTVRVTALLHGEPRIVREAVTEVPSDRVAMLRIPLQWLCDGLLPPEQGEAAAEGQCGQGQTCVAGRCVSNEVEVDLLPDYSPALVFGFGPSPGPGLCFDAAACALDAQRVEVDRDACTIAVDGDVNVALATETDGICGPAGCFVPLTARSDSGWTEGSASGVLDLPPAVCDRLEEGRALGVVTMPVSGHCPLMTEAIPVCGTWSSVGSAVAPGTDGPVTLAAGQARPVELLTYGDRVYWTQRGLQGAEHGEIRSAPIGGGARTTVAGVQDGARSMALEGALLYWTAVPVAGEGALMRLDLGGGVSAQPSVLLAEQPAPEGIAVEGGEVFFVDYLDGAIRRLGATAPLADLQLTPFRVVVDIDRVFWTNQGTRGEHDGSVMMAPRSGGEVVVLAQGQRKPRRLALELDTSGRAAAVVWVNHDYEGSVMRAPVGATGPAGPPQELASDQRYPGGVALDAEFVYWTNRYEGTVMRLSRGAPAGEVPEVLANEQDLPSAIAVDAVNVYWINEGSAEDATGAVMWRAKP